MAAAKKNAKPADTEAPVEKGTKAKAEKVAKEPKPKQEERNGITRPKPGTTVGRVWEIADSLSKLNLKKPEIAKRKDVLTACENEGINPSTAATQFGRWRRFNGIEGRLTDEEK